MRTPTVWLMVTPYGSMTWLPFWNSSVRTAPAWYASTARMPAAGVRYALLEMSAAAPCRGHKCRGHGIRNKATWHDGNQLQLRTSSLTLNMLKTQ